MHPCDGHDHHDDERSGGISCIRAGREEQATEKLRDADEHGERESRNEAEILEDAGHRRKASAAPNPKELLSAVRDEDSRQGQAEDQEAVIAHPRLRSLESGAHCILTRREVSMLTRRAFLHRSGAAGGAALAALTSDSLVRAAEAGARVAGRSADEVAADETYWAEIQRAFTPTAP